MFRLENVRLVANMYRIIVVEGKSSCIKSYTQLFKFGLKFRIVVSWGQIQRKEG